MGQRAATATRQQQIDQLIDDRMKNAPQSKGEDLMAVLAPSSVLNWPGALLSGQQLGLGLAHLLRANRAPITISNSVSRATATVPDPTMSAVRLALAHVAVVPPDSAVEAKLSMKSAKFTEQFDAEIRAAGSTLTAQFSGNASISNDTDETLVLLQLSAKFFSVDMDTIRDAASFFAESETADALGKLIPSDDFPVVVRSVGYGRAAYIVARTSADATDFEAALTAAYSAAKGDGAGHVTAAQKTMIEKASMMSVSYGLSGEGTATVIATLRDLEDVVKTFLTTPATSAVPIDITTAAISNSMKPMPIPVGAIRLTLTKVYLKAESTPPHGNYKPFGYIHLDYAEFGADSYTRIFTKDKNWSGSHAHATNGHWGELDADGDTCTVESGLSTSFDVSDNGGVIRLKVDIWDYFSGSPNEKIGSATGHFYWSDITSRLLGNSEIDGEEPALYLHVTPESSDWGSVAVKCKFTWRFTT